MQFESGIVMTFRRFTVVRMLLFLFVLLINWMVDGWQVLSNWAFPLMLLDVGLLIVYLSLPRLRTMMKGAYLPIGIIWATLGPMLQIYVFFLILIRSMPDRSIFLLTLEPILVLFIPLIITAWRYSMRTVLLFCGLTFLLDALLAATTYTMFTPVFPRAAIIAPIMGMAFTRTVLFFFVGNMINNLMQVQRRQNTRLVQYAATIEQLTISRERNRVARELHDVLAHTMSGVAVELEGVRAILHVDTDQAETLLNHSLSAVREGLNETRRALQALRASPLEDLGLGLAIKNLTETIAGPASLITNVQIDKDIPDYPNEIQQAFYRVAQEALTNVVTHAQASWVQVSLTQEGTILKLQVQDDGIGFDEKTIDSQQKYGLLGIRERAEIIHGHLSIESKIGAGTVMLFLYDANPGEVAHGTF